MIKHGDVAVREAKEPYTDPRAFVESGSSPEAATNKERLDMQQKTLMPLVKGNKNLLRKAFFKAINQFSGQMMLRKHSDTTGTYAVETTSFILTAKDYICNGIVSVHSDVVKLARDKNKPLLMYIANEDKFLRFNPTTICQNSFRNFRIARGRNVEMVNFKAALAENNHNLGEFKG